MPNQGPFPSPLPEFNDYIDIVVPYLNANAARLGVSGANLAVLNPLYDLGGVAQNQLGWKQLWVLYSNADTVTKSIRDIVKIRRGQLETRLRLIYGDIPNSALTANDRNTLNLPLRDTTPTPILAVDFSPVISFHEIKNGVQVLRFQNPTTPDSNAMPPGQKTELQTFVGAAGLVDDAIAFGNGVDNGKHLYKVILTPGQKGQTAYYRARYKTETGKTGPWSDVESEIVL